MIPYLLVIVGGYLIGQSFDKKKFEDGGEVSNLDYNSPDWYNKSYDEKLKIEKERLEAAGIEIGDVVSKLEDKKLLTGTVKMYKDIQGLISPIMVEFDSLTQKATGSKRDRIEGYKLYLKKNVAKAFKKKLADGGTIEYDVEIEAIDEEDGNKYRFVYDIIANNNEEALEKAKNMFMSDDYGNLTIKEAKIKHEYEFMAKGGVTGEAFLENPRFTFSTIDEYENAKRTGYIDTYDIVRVVMQNDFRTVDYPVHSLEEYNQIKNNENKAKFVVKSYQEKHAYDIQDYYDPEEDREDNEHEGYDDDYAKGGKIKKSKIKKKKN